MGKGEVHESFFSNIPAAKFIKGVMTQNLCREFPELVEEPMFVTRYSKVMPLTASHIPPPTW